MGLGFALLRVLLMLLDSLACFHAADRRLLYDRSQVGSMIFVVTIIRAG